MKKLLFSAIALWCISVTTSLGQTTFINEDFSTGSGTTPPTGWTPFIMPLTSNPAVDSFHFDNPTPRTLNAPITDPACIFDSDLLSNDGTVEQVLMISPTINTTAEAVVMLEFDQFLDASFGGQAFVIVTDGILQDTVFNSAVSSPDPDHQTLDISLVGAGKATVNIIFMWTGNWSMFWIFDNVNVYSPAAIDVGVIALDAPISGCGLTATESVTISVVNFGSAATDTIPVAYTIDGGAAVIDTIFPSLAAGDTTVFTFATTADLSTPATYIFDSWTDMPGDGDNTNDSTLGYSVSNTTINTFPYLENFEAEPNCGINCGDPCILVGLWTNAGGDDIDWTSNQGGTGSVGTGPSADNTTGLATGQYMYTEASGGCFPTSEARLESPCIDVTSLALPALSFFYHMAGVEMGTLFTEVDSGSGYVVVNTITGPQQAVETDPWLQQIVPLTGYTGIINIRFRGVTGTNFDSDIAIDDINVYDAPPIDVSVLSINAPTSSCGLTASETITVEVVNFGSTTIDTIPVAYTIDGGTPVIDTIFTAVLAGDTTTLSFSTTGDFSTPATYIIDAWTQLTGDGNNLNDSVLGFSVMNTAIISTLPYVEDFESGAGSWSTAGINSSWAIGAPTAPFIAAAANGTNAWITNLTGNYNNDEDSYLISPCLDFSSLTADPILSFSHIFATEDCCDQGWVEYSTNSGNTWSKLGTSTSGTNWYNDAGNDWWNDTSDVAAVWRTAEHPLTGLGGQDSIRIRFVMSSDFSVPDEGFGVDDINIYELPAADVGVANISAPTSSCGLSASETITVQVINFGSGSIDTIPVAYSIDGGGPVIDTIFATILPGDTATLSFSTTGDFSTPGTYIIDAWTQITGDANNLNDSVLGYSVTNTPTISTLPYIEDFESGAGGWTDAGIFSSWAIGAPTATFIPAAANGTNAWVTNLTGDYNNNEASYLVSPCLDFSSLTADPILNFSHIFVTEACCDEGWVEYSTNSGTTWTKLGASTSGTNWYNDGGNDWWDGNSGASGVWRTAEHTLTGLGGQDSVRIRFVFSSDNSVIDEGFGVDDINVYELPTEDVGVANISTPTSSCGLSASETITVQVINFGSGSIDTIPVAYSIDGGGPVTDTIFATILPGDTATLSFSTPGDFSTPGTYIIDAWTQFTGDGNNTNDSTLGVIVFHPTPITVFPYIEDFEAETACGTTCGTACPLSGNWLNDTGSDDIDFTVDAGGTTSLGTGPAVDHTTGTALGNYLYTEASGCNGMTAVLGSICLDITVLTNPTLSYWYHMAGTDMGNLYVLADTGTWVVIDSVIGQQQGVETDPWNNSTVNLTPYSGTIQLAFIAITGAGFESDIAIDDINVFDNVTPGDDAGVVNIITPASHCEDGSTDIITVQVVNLGTVTLDTIPVGYTVNGGPVELDTVVATLLPGDTVTFAFPVGSVLSPAGAYSIDAWTNLVGDINNNNDSANLGITIFTNPSIALGADINICSGATATLNTTNFGYSSYLWNTGATDSTITTLVAGSFILTVTDNNGCTDADTIAVTINPTMTLTTSAVDATCGASDGTATVVVAGGTTPYSYLWNDPGLQTNTTANGLAAASYTVVVTDSFGCMDSATVAVNNAGAPTVATSAVSNISCAGGADGIAEVSITGGTSPYTYLWDDLGAQSTDTATGLTALTFTVTVTDNAGCIATDVVTLTEPPALTLTASNASSNCGQSDGSASVAVIGGTGVYTYLWDDLSSQTTGTASNLVANTYNVIVTDANACTDNVSTTVSDIAGGVASISASTNASCNGVCDGDATASIVGGTAPFTYLWDDPAVQTNAMAISLCASTVKVTITDINGCIDSSTVTITEPAPMTLTTASADAACGNPDGSASVAVTGGSGPYTYVWNDPGVQTNDTATGLAAGAYLVIVTDASGCLDSNVATVNNVGGPTATITASTNILCNGAATGGATVSATGGTTPYTYLWSDPSAQTNTVAGGLTAGLYTVTVTDGNSCVSTDFVTLTEALAISSTTSSTDESCPGSCNGSATVVAGGGTGAFTYLWNDPGAQTNAIASALCAITHTVTITDGNGCVVNNSATVNSGAGFTTSTTSNDASCGSADGSATVSITGGTAPFTYLWDDLGAQTNASALSLVAGVYNVLVTDANGCTDTQSATINNLGAPTASITSSTDALCNGGTSGAATANGVGGSGPYTYLWDDLSAQTTATAVGLPAGLYNVGVTDSLGCTGTVSVTINEPTALASVTSKTDAVCNAACDGTVAVSVTGGTAPYTYLWDDPSTQTNATATGLCASTVTVVVTDNNGCIDGGTETVGEPVAIGLTSTVVDASCGGSDGSITVTATLGTAPYTYLWNDPANQTNATASNLASGTYINTVTDANGCTNTISATVGNVSGPTVTTSGTNATCLGCTDGTVTATPAGGTAPYTYLWDDSGAQTTATANGLAAGTYNVVVTDAAGCSANGNVTITEPSSTVFTLEVNTANVVCNGDCDGVATAVTQNGSAPFTYQWDDPLAQTTVSATGLCIGTYNVTVTDDTGAVLMSTFTIYQPSKIDIVPTIVGATCGSSDGTITLNVTGGTPGYLYAWLSGGSTAIETGLAAGSYTVTVTDANSCTGVKSITVGNANGPTVAVSSTDITCFGAGDGSATATVTGGTAPYTYLWDDPGTQATATANGLIVGSYTVIVTDAGGCTNTSSAASVTEPSALTSTVTMVDATAGVCNGAGTVITSGGTPPYQYLWDDPSAQTKMTATSLCPGIYIATVTDANSCTAQGIGTVSSVIGIEEQLIDATFVLYPNPTDNRVWIERTGANSHPITIGWDLIIYDFTGKVILTKNQIADASIEIRLGDLPNGIYLAKITAANGDVSAHKIILE